MTSDSQKGYTEHLLAFCNALRDRGVLVTTDDIVSAAHALSSADVLDEDAVYYSLKATLITDPDQIDCFDEIFEAWWMSRGGERQADDSDVPEIDESGITGVGPSAADTSDEKDDRDSPQSETGTTERKQKPSANDDASSTGRDTQRRQEEVSRNQEFAAERIVEMFGDRTSSNRPSVQVRDSSTSDRELSLLVGELGKRLGTLEEPETRRSSSGRLDLRRALNQSRTRGPNALPREKNRRNKANIRLFVDVSRSMLRNIDLSFLFRFLFECVQQYVDSRVYFFDTTTTEVTHYFETADLTRTVEEMHRAQTQWGAGTEIGHCIEEVLAAEPFAIENETVTIIVSDGWDAGDLDRLAAQLASIERRGRLLVWLNPLATSSEYEPAVGGMATALPHIDFFYGFDSVADLHRIVHDLQSRTPAEKTGHV